MPKAEEELEKVTLNMYRGDMDRLREFYPDIGASAMVRRLVRRFIVQVEKEGGPRIDTEVEIKI
jgi:hypothetical protein